MAVLDYDGKRSFVGRVLAEREYNGYHDSDFYALVYSDETDSVYEVEFATTRGGCGAAFGTYVDATDETLDKAEAVFKRDALDRLRLNDIESAKTVEKGKTVTVTRKYRSRKLGRTLNPGDTGTVVWYGRGFGQTYAEKYGRTPPMRAGVKFEGETETLFLDSYDVEVVGWEDLLKSEETLREEADRAGRNRRRELETRYAKRYAEGRAKNERAATALEALFAFLRGDSKAVAA